MILDVYFVICCDFRYDYMNIYDFFIVYLFIININYIFVLIFVFIVYELTLTSLFVREVNFSCFTGILKSDF